MTSMLYLILFGLMVSGARLLPAQGASEHLALGDSAEAEFKPADALKHFEAAIELDPRSGVALSKAARSAVDLGEAETDPVRKKELFRLAEGYARRAVVISPDDPEAHFGLARALGRAALSVGVRDRVRYAVDVREQGLTALKLDPNHPGALHVLGMWNAEVMRLNGFERFFAKNVLGGRVLGQANWNDARTYLERAVEVDPERLVHHLDLAKIYADVGEKAKAREQYEWVLGASKRTDVNDALYKRQAEVELKRLK